MRKKEKQSKWGIFLVAFIALVMISSVIGFLYGGETNQFKYGDIKFIRTVDGWQTSVNNKRVTFDYFPGDLEYIEMDPAITMLLANKPEVDLTSNTEDLFLEDIALAQYNMNLVLNNLNVYVRMGFDTNNSFDLPIITCEDSSMAVPVIYFKRSNQTNITLEDSCVIVEASNSNDVLRIKDRLLYSMIGIIG
ncbi:MAG: hypothetical protein U9O94_10840 [Nanoarchaeota archaeon]|nr:hypothetical protein [Nanoarchaeota archaeon]